MGSIPISAIFVTCLILISCSGRGPLALEETPSRAIFRQDLSTVPMDPASITGALVQGDQLLLQVRYGGGCAEHHFALYVLPIFMESEPVQVGAQLAHDAHGDACRALVGKELQFDLRPLKEAYQKAYSRNGTLVLRLREPGPAPSTVSVRYSF
jgi:hypothetical protein